MIAMPPPPGLTDADFERIEAAVMETERGRWFLAEYARRVRAEGSEAISAALGRIEETLSWSAPGLAASAARRLLARAEAIEESLEDLAWRLREAGAEAACAAVEAEILTLRALAVEPAGEGQPNAGGAAALQGSPAPRRALPTDTPGGLSDRLQKIDHRMAADAAAPDPRLAAFAPLEALSPRDRLAFFA